MHLARELFGDDVASHRRRSEATANQSPRSVGSFAVTFQLGKLLSINDSVCRSCFSRGESHSTKHGPVGTAVTAPAFSYLREIRTENEGLVDQTGIEPVTS